MWGGLMHSKVLTWVLRFFFYAVIFTHTLPSHSQCMIVDSILIQGNHYTNDAVILRELTIRQGDTLPALELWRRMTTSEARLESTSLFTKCNVFFSAQDSTPSQGNVVVVVTENWYLYPYVIFEPADRNYNVWIKEQSASLARVNYGLAAHHLNLTGNKDFLKCKWHTGYTQKAEVSYEYPYLYRNLGLAASFLYADQREIAYRSLFNKPVFFKSEDEQKLLFQKKWSLSLLHRTSPLLSQTVRFESHRMQVADLISEGVNRQYLGNGRSSVAYTAIEFLVRFDNTLFPLYPTDGFRMDVRIKKEGLTKKSDIQTLSISYLTEKFTPLWRNLFLAQRLKIRRHIHSQPLPYFLNNGIGYKEDKMTGYDLFVLDGRDFFLLNQSLRYCLTNKDIAVSKRMPTAFRTMNVKAFFRFSFDTGYARDPLHKDQNPYANTLQYGYGPGIDLLFYNNLFASFTYGVTKFGAHSWYIDAGFVF